MAEPLPGAPARTPPPAFARARRLAGVARPLRAPPAVLAYGQPRAAGLAQHAPMLALALAVLGPLAVAMLVLQPHLAGGDSGQWVMLARAYEGLPVPGYRDAFAVPPAAPLLTLAFLALTSDAFLAPKLALLTAFALVPLGAFLVGRELFGWLPGAVAAAMVGVGQNFYLRLAVFGALPQLLAVAAFGATLAAIARWHREPTPRHRAYVALAAVGILAAHAPTAAVALPVLAVAMLALPPRARLGPSVAASARSVLVRLAPLAPAGLLFAGYAWLKRGAFEAYLENEAAFHFKGLGPAVGELLELRATTILLLAGGAVLLLLLLRALAAALPPERAGPLRSLAPRDPAAREAHQRAAVLLALPPLLLGALMLALHAAHVGTDYPRIFPLLGFPALVSLAALVPPLQPRELRGWVRSREAAAFALAGMLMLPTIAGVVAAEQRAMPFYSVKEPEALRAALAEVDARVPPGSTVWAPVREGKWLEGVTGRSALFGLPAWAIFRPWEWERKVAAETLYGGSAWLGTGHVGALFQRSPSVTQDNPLVRVYYKGELQPVLRFDDGSSRLRVLLPGPAEVPLSDLAARSEVVREAGGKGVVEQRAQGTTWTWAGAPVQLEVVRKATVEPGGDDITLDFHVRSQGAPLEAVTFVLRPWGSAAWVTRFDNGTAVASTTRNAEPLDLTLRPSPEGMARIEATEGGTGQRVLLLQLTPVDGPAGPRSEARAQVRMTAAPVGTPPAAFEVLSAEQALDRYDADWALFPWSDRVGRASAEALGFESVYQNEAYQLYRRGGAA